MRFLPYIIFAVSIILFTATNYSFSSNKNFSANVKNATTINLYNIPLNATLVSYDTNQNNKTITYTTSLTLDQILEFYDKYATLSNWKKIDFYNYTTNNISVVIKIDRDSENRNLVTYKENISN